MAIILNGTSGITTPDVDTTDLTLTGAFNGVDAILSGGVYLGGTGSANKLDDYEEGTWTPTSGNSGVVIGDNGGKYIKVGRLVYVSTLITISSATSSSSYFDVNGLPFAQSSDAGSHGGGAAMSQYVMSSAQQLMPFIATSTQNVRFYQSDSGAWRRIDHSDLSASSDIYLTMHYYTDL